MTRKHISTRARLGVFERHNGTCHLCAMKIHAGEAWDISHAIPLAIGGADDETNWLPAHRSCHRAHTAKIDAPRIAKTKRQHAAHIGAKSPSRNPMPGGRGSQWKRKMDGSWERREK